jgi:serine/threonine protein kinase
MRPGDVIDPQFRIERRAGTGGMGAVCHARDLARDAPVALKILKDAGSEYRARLTREARVLSRLERGGSALR